MRGVPAKRVVGVRCETCGADAKRERGRPVMTIDHEPRCAALLAQRHAESAKG